MLLCPLVDQTRRALSKLESKLVRIRCGRAARMEDRAVAAALLLTRKIRPIAEVGRRSQGEVWMTKVDDQCRDVVPASRHLHIPPSCARVHQLLACVER